MIEWIREWWAEKTPREKTEFVGTSLLCTGLGLGAIMIISAAAIWLHWMVAVVLFGLALMAIGGVVLS